MHHVWVISEFLLEFLLELLLGAFSFEHHVGHLIEAQVVHLDSLPVQRGKRQDGGRRSTGGGGQQQGQ